MSKKVIVSGVTGQFGSFMVEYLLKNTDYEIHGMVRRLSVKNHKNIEHLKNNPRFHLFSGDLTDGHSLTKSIEEIKPDYYISAGAQSFVSESWISPVNTFITDSVAIIYILEAIRKIVPYCRFINMGSSEQFGDVQYSPQDINHPFRSRSPYAAAKVAAHQIVKVYRESYNLYALQPICFNYESERRGEEFVTRKITKGVAKIYHAIKNNFPIEPIELGNLDSQRDWSDCEDFVDGVWKMLNQPTLKPKEYVLASGETHTIREFIEKTVLNSGVIKEWRKKYDLKGEIELSWGPFYTEKDALVLNAVEYTDCFLPLIKINSKFYRPNEVSLLCGDSTPIRQDLGWEPKTSFLELVKKMVAHDIAALDS